ncbi:VWA domain-containing protein [Gynuella sp.]|uniref:VWA domain-containing protein n=1 Tax=Gynuella sp. TaxID=2969146 RepID=UPI003D0CC37D
MNKTKNSCFGALVVWWLLLSTPMFSAAETSGQPLDVRILIDISGSMVENDPNNLRIPALNLLIDLLPDDTRAGVWTFGRYVNMLVPYGSVNDQWRTNARRQASKINSLGQRTALGSVLEKSAFDFTISGNGVHPQFILLSDGMADISPELAANIRERNRILNQVLPRFRRQQAPIHTIALSAQADLPLLRQLSMQTQGLSEQVNNADDLMSVFLRIFDTAVPSEQVPIKANAFTIDSHVNEMTVLVFREALAKPIKLISPDGEVFATDSDTRLVTWKSTDKYDLVTIKNPAEGAWVIDGRVQADSRVTVVSDVMLVLENLPVVMFPGQDNRLEAFLNSREGDVNDDEFLQMMNINLTASPDQPGQNLIVAQMVLNGDRFSVPLDHFLNQPGNYTLEVALDGQTFQRRISRTISVQAHISAETTVEGNHYRIRIYANNPAIDVGRSTVTATVKNATVQQSLEFNWNVSGYWQADVGPYADTVTLEPKLDIYLQGALADGITIAPQQLNFPIGSTQPMTMDAEVMVQPEPSPQPNLPPAKFAIETVAEIPKEQALQRQEQRAKEMPATKDNWMNEPSGSDKDSLGIGTMLLWSLPGILVIGGFAVAYVFINRRRAEMNTARDAMEQEIQQLDEAAEARRLENEEQDEAVAVEEEAPVDADELEEPDGPLIDGLLSDDEDFGSLEDLDHFRDDDGKLSEDEEDVFDLGDLSDLSDELEDDKEDSKAP